MPDTTYTTTQGEMWDQISLAVYGTEKKFDVLIAANPEHRKTVLFSAGTVLNVPEIDTTTLPGTLPPWKQ